MLSIIRIIVGVLIILISAFLAYDRMGVFLGIVGLIISLALSFYFGFDFLSDESTEIGRIVVFIALFGGSIFVDLLGFELFGSLMAGAGGIGAGILITGLVSVSVIDQIFLLVMSPAIAGILIFFLILCVVCSL